MANSSKTFTPDNTWTLGGDMALSGSRAKLTAAASYYDDFESYSIGATPTNWSGLGGATCTVQSLDGQKVMQVNGSGNVGAKHSQAIFGEGMFEAQWTASSTGRYSFLCSRWSTAGAYGIKFVHMAQTGGTENDWLTVNTSATLASDVYPYYLSGEQVQAAPFRLTDLGAYPQKVGLQVTKDSAVGDNHAIAWVNDVLIRRYRDTQVKCSGSEIGIGVPFYSTFGYVKFWPLKSGSLETPDYTPAVLNSWKKVTFAADLRASLVTRLSLLLQYSTNSGSTWTAVPDDGDLSAVSGTKIRFKIASIKNGLNSSWDLSVYGLGVEIDGVWENAPAAPTSVTATSAGPSQINLTWTDAPTAEAYRIYYNTTNNIATASAGPWVLQGVQAASVMGLNASTLYYFWLKAENYTGGVGSASTVASATTAAAAVPAAPANLRVNSQSATDVVLGWDVVGGSPTYKVYRAKLVNANRLWDSLTYIGNTTSLTFTDNAANSTPDPVTGDSYIYVVTATTTVEGPASNPVLATFRTDAISGLEVTDFFGPLQKAIYTRLKDAGITYTDPIDGQSKAVPVWDKPPEDAAFPLIVAGEVSASAPANTKTRAGQDIIYTIHVLSDYRGLKEAALIGAQVARQISAPKIDLVADGLAVVVSKLQGAQARELGDGLTIDYAVQFAFKIFEDPAQRP